MKNRRYVTVSAGIILALVITSARSGTGQWSLPDGFPFTVTGPPEKSILVYNPPPEIRQKISGNDPVLMIEYVSQGGRYRRDILKLTPRSSEWIATLSPKKEDVLIAFKVEAGEAFDDNSGYGYWMLRIGQNGKPVKDALRQEGRIYEAYDRREGTTDYEKALQRYNEELRLYPDNTEAIHDRFRALKKSDAGNASRIQGEAIGWATEALAKSRNPEALLTAMHIFLDRDLDLDMRAEAYKTGREFLQRFPRHTGADTVRYLEAIISEYASPREKADAFGKVAQKAKDDLIRAQARLEQCNALLEANDTVALAECASTYVSSAPTSRFFWDGIIYAKEWANALADAGNEAGTFSVVDGSLKRILSREFDLGYMWRFPVSRRVKRNYEHAQFLTSRAKLERRIGAAEQALKSLGKALPLLLEDPDIAGVLREMSEINEATGDFRNALAHARAAYERDPYDGELERRLRALWVKVNGSDRGLADYQKSVRKKNPGEKAPNFRVTLFGGEVMTLADLEGSIVVLNFWATWCGPCIKEIPSLNALVDSFKNVVAAKKLRFIAITNEGEKRVDWFQKKQPFHYTIAVNGARVTETYQAFAYPTHIVIDHKGRIRYRQIGATEKIDEKLRAIIERLLDESRNTDRE